jgi:urea transport system ATP-binding protein
MPHPLLSVEDVSKTYDGFKAISNLTFYLYAGELRTVIGPNGAGKSTFFDLISGARSPTVAASSSAPARCNSTTWPS